MANHSSSLLGRRELLKTSALAALGSGLLGADGTEAYPKGVNTNSGPSALSITDQRVATNVKPDAHPDGRRHLPEGIV